MSQSLQNKTCSDVPNYLTTHRADLSMTSFKASTQKSACMVFESRQLGKEDVTRLVAFLEALKGTATIAG
jgi:cytochrome c553